MKVRELIAELQKMPPEADVTMWMEPGKAYASVQWVEKRTPDDVYLNDIYYTPYAKECDVK